MIERYQKIRNRTLAICEPLATEDYVVQPIEDVSPPKWHLAHSTWFFEQFVLSKYAPNYSVFNGDFSYLFNSYYNNVGDKVIRANRGLMTRPTVSEIRDYRLYVDEHMATFLATKPNKEILQIIELGLNHEEQHQELLIYDIKYILGHQPTFPSYGNQFQLKKEKGNGFVRIEEGLYEIGYNGNKFHFDNEENQHQVFVQQFDIAENLVSNKEWIAFIEAGGYQNFNLWHAEGWDWVQQNDIKAPMYWYKHQGEWMYYNMSDFVKVDENLPVMHVNFYEAHAFAEWKNQRLPTEQEWEIASSTLDYGQLWEWTNSAYLPYPGYAKAEGAIGEYNGKFMVNQMVLRGASIASADGHSRTTYRNFFHPHLRWQFCGLRLVKK